MVGFHIYVSFPHVTQSLGISLAATFMLCLIHTYNTYLSIHPSIYLAHIWPWINSYRYSLLGDEHPFATDVHQGYMVLTHSHMCVYIYNIHVWAYTYIPIKPPAPWPCSASPSPPQVAFRLDCAEQDNGESRGCNLLTLQCNTMCIHTHIITYIYTHNHIYIYTY